MAKVIYQISENATRVYKLNGAQKNKNKPKKSHTKNFTEKKDEGKSQEKKRGIDQNN